MSAESEQVPLDLGELFPAPLQSAGRLVKQVHATIVQLHEDNRIGPTDAGRVALAQSLAEVIERKTSSGRMSTIGQDAKVLMEILDGFREDAKGEADLMREAMEQWTEVIDRLGLNPPPSPLAAAS